MAKSNIPNNEYSIKVSLEGAIRQLCGDGDATIFILRLYFKSGWHLSEKDRSEIKTMTDNDTGKSGYFGQTREEWVYETGIDNVRVFSRAVKKAQECGAVHSVAKKVSRTYKEINLHKIKKSFVDRVHKLTTKDAIIFHTLTKNGTDTKNGKGQVSPLPKTVRVTGTLTKNGKSQYLKDNTLKEEYLKRCSADAVRSATHNPKFESKEDSREGYKMKESKNREKIKQTLKNKKGKTFEEIHKDHESSPEEQKDISSVRGYELYWKKLRKKFHPGNFELNWTGREQGYAKSVMERARKAEGHMPIRDFTRTLIEHWQDAAEYVADRLNRKNGDPTPNIGHVSRNTNLFLDWYLQFDDTPKVKSNVMMQHVFKPGEK
jgi:mannose/fructose/N-acetylgalactosamine-specific phosphotransferase system component IIB